MASKRIYQLAKEFECDEKKIIDFLTGQGIKVANRLSAVNEDIYNLLKEKLFAPPPPPPPPPPKPEPKPEPVEEKSAQVAPAEEKTAPAPAQAKKKKKKKNKAPQPEDEQGEQAEQSDDEEEISQPFDFEKLEAASKVALGSSIVAGNGFINRYSKRKGKMKTILTRNIDAWWFMQEIKVDDPDSSPIKYWQAVNKFTTSAYKLVQAYGLKNRELMAEMRETVKNVGSKYEPQEIFTDEENQKFEAQQKAIFEAFGHGMGKVNDNLYELKMYAENKKRYCEHMSFVDYLTNPDSALETKVPMPFYSLAEAIAYSVRSVVWHANFYRTNKELIVKAIENFYAWIDGYKKLKEQGADAAKLEKYLYLEEKMFSLIEFMSFDNLIFFRKNKPAPFASALDLLNEYRDNMDDPDAERNFKYKMRGLASILYKPKEYIFLYQFADLEPHKDYRTPEMIAEAEAKKAAAEAAKAAEEAEKAAQAEAEKENPAAESGEA